MADVESATRSRRSTLFRPQFTLQELKKPQRFVTIILSIVCIVLCLVASLCAAVTISELDFPDLSSAGSTTTTTYGDSIENTRTQTEVVCAFVIISTVATLFTRGLVIVVTTLNFPFVEEYGILVLIADVVSGLLCAAVFFALAVPMAVYSGEWIEFKDLVVTVYRIYGLDPRNGLDFFHLDVLVPSTGATSAFGFLTMFALIAASAWTVLSKFIFKKPAKNANTPAGYAAE